jgi:Large polyvalent protein associated domain 22
MIDDVGTPDPDQGVGQQDSEQSVAQQMLQDGSLPDKPAAARSNVVPMRAVFAAASTMNPDKEAQAQQLSQQTGMGVDLVRSNPEAAQQRARIADLDRRSLEITNPILASQLQDPNFAGVAHDDLDSLSRIEQHAGVLGRAWGEVTSAGTNAELGLFGAFKPFIDAGGAAVQGALESPKPVMDALTGIDPDLEGLKRVWTNPRTFWIQRQTEAIQNWLSSGIIHGPQQYVTDPSTQQPVKNPAYRWWGRDLANVIEQVPGTLAAFALTGKAAGASADALGAEGTSIEGQSVPTVLGTEAAQNTYAQARANGADQKSAIMAALASGVANYTLMGKMPGAVPTSTVSGAVSQWAARSAALGTGMTLVDNTIARGYDPDRGLMEGLPQSIATMAAFEGVGALGHIVDAAAESKLRKRAPEVFQSSMDSMFQGQESLRIPAQDFVNYFVDKDIDPAATANQLGVTNLHEAIAAGSDLEIPTANYVARLDPEHQRGLLPDIIDPTTEMTGRQAEAGRAELQQWIADGGADKLQADFAQADAETQATPEWQKVHDDLKQRYQDAGETETAAENYATLQSNAIANLARRAGLKPDELLALHNPQVVAGDAPGTQMLNQSVFHGSPYEFDQFSLDHTGEGEGAQAYGYGLYFAGDKALAEHYRKTLAGDRPTIDGKAIDPTRADHIAAGALAVHEGDKAEAIKDLQSTVDRPDLYPDGVADTARKAIDLIRSGEKLPKAELQKGQLYEADIPEDHTMLDWDKPLSEQSGPVKKALGVIERDQAAEQALIDRAAKEGKPVTDYPEYKQLEAQMDEARKFSDQTGEEYYRGLSESIAGSQEQADSLGLDRATNDKGASAFLLGKGIDGIKYLDGSSRSAGEGSHNYVVFDENAIKILNTFYQGEGDQHRGWFRMLPDGRYEIGKTKIGDVSTFIHEPAHAYLELFRELTQREGTSQPLKDDFKKITDWLGTTPEEAYKNGFTREQHEQWARANEEYVREGKAPTSGLQRAFHNFAVWLGSIYRRAGALGVDLSSDIRGVMDRLYAGDSAVERAEQESGHQQLFESPEEAGWTEEEFRNYARGRGVEEMEARKLILSEMKDAAVRERTQAWREEKGNVRDAVTDQVDAQPEYRAIRSLRRGMLDDDETRLTLNRDMLVKQFGEDRVKALQDLHRGLYRSEGGTDAETAAELLGFGSGEEMMRALENTPRRAQAIEAATRDTMTARHGDIRYDGSLDDKARLAVENNERAQNLHKELAALRRKVATLEKRAADTKAAMASITIEPLERYQEAAHQMIEQKAIADLQPSRYLNASRKFSREAFDALRKGNVKAAADAKNKELLNHFLFREASAGRDYAEKFASYVKRVQSTGIQQRLGLADQNARQAGRVGDYRDQFNWLMARYRLGPQPQAPERSLRAWAEEADGLGNDVVIDPSIMDGDRTRFVDYRNAPLSEVRNVHDALINIRHLAQREFQMYVQGKKVAFAEAKQSMIAAARENLKTKPETTFDYNRSMLDRALDPLRYVDARLIRMERLVEWLDGGKAGPWHDNLWNLASDAQGDEYTLQEKVTKQVTDALEDMPAEMRRRLWTEKLSVEGIPEPLARRSLLSVAFNMGNEGNLDRLRKTFIDKGWDPESIRKIGGMLTREEWNFVQRAWDSLKPLGDRANELQQRLTGLPLQMVKVTPFKVALDDGTEMDLAGGYFPIVMDPEHSQRAIEQDAKETAQNAMQSGYVRATTSKGYTKARTGYGGQLLLDYEQGLTSHVAKVAKDLSHREFMLMSQRFLLDNDVRRTLRETLGRQYEKQFMPWLRTIINDNNGSVQEGTDTVKAGMQKLRGNIVAASLGFNASTSLLQISHAPRMLLYAKPASLTQAFLDLVHRPIEATREIRDLSPNEMRFRGDNLDRDIRAVLQQPEYRSGYTRKVGVAARFALEMMDHLLSHTLWRAAFNDSLTKYTDLPEDQAQEKAAHEADSAVRLGLGTSAPKDLPAVMRNNEFNKFITTLYGFHNGVYNQLRDMGHQFRYDRNVGRLTYAAVLTAVLPAVMGNWVTGRGPKDGENLGWWAAKRSLAFAGDTVPFLRSAISFLEGGHDVQFSPIEGVIQKGAKAAMNAAADKPDKDWMGIGLDAAESGSEMLGVPGSHQAVKTLRYIKRASEGKVQNPNPWNAIVGGGS